MNRSSLLSRLKTVWQSPTGVTLLLLLVLGGLCALAYSQALSIYFRSDDWVWLDNTVISIHFRDNLTRSWFGYFRPLTQIVFYTIYRIFGAEPDRFALFSLIIHVINGYIVYHFTQLMSKKRLAGVLAAIIFICCLSPLQTITYASDFGGLIASGLLTLSLIFFILAEQRKNWWLFGASLFLYTISLGFKEASIAYFAIFIAYAVLLMTGQPLWQRALKLVPFSLISIYFFIVLSFGVGYFVNRQHGPTTLTDNSVFTWLSNMSTFLTTFFPVHPATLDQFITQQLLYRSLWWQIGPAVVGVLAVIVTLIVMWKKRSPMTPWITWLLAAIGIAIIPYNTFPIISGYDGSRYFAFSVISASVVMGIGLAALFEVKGWLTKVLSIAALVALVGTSVFWIRKGVALQAKLSLSGQQAMANIQKAMPIAEPPKVIIIDTENNPFDFYLYNFAIAALYPQYDVTSPSTQTKIATLIDNIQPSGQEKLLLQSTGRIAVYGDEHFSNLISLVKTGDLQREDIVYLHYDKTGQLAQDNEKLDRILANESALCLAKGLTNSENVMSHKLYRLVDGQYGNNNTWLGSEDTTKSSWIMFALPTTTSISQFSWTRDKTGNFTDRFISSYLLEGSTDRENWETLREQSAGELATNEKILQFAPTAVKYIRLTINKTVDGLPPAIDEITFDGPSGLVCNVE